MRTIRLAPTLAALALSAAPVLAQRLPPAAATTETSASVTPYAGIIMFGNYLNGPLGTSVRSRPAPIGGAQIAVPVASGVRLVGNVGYSSGDLEIGVPILGGLRVGSSTSWVYDAGLELALGQARERGIVPFLQAGGGAITTKLSSGPLNTTSTNPAFNAAAGVDVGLGRTAGLRLQVKDYVGRFASQSVAGVEARGDVTHNVAVSAGLKLSF